MLFSVSGVDMGCNRDPAEATLMETASIGTVYTLTPTHEVLFFLFFRSRAFSASGLIFGGIYL